MLGVQPFGGTEVHRNSVLNDPILFQNPVEYSQWPPTVQHVVFRDNLEPVNGRLPFQDMAVVRNPEADADSVFSKSVEAIGRHESVQVLPGNLDERHPGSVHCLLGSLRRLATVRCAATLALAVVFPLAAVIAALAAALTLAIILAFAGVFGGVVQARLGVRNLARR